MHRGRDPLEELAHVVQRHERRRERSDRRGLRVGRTQGARVALELPEELPTGKTLILPGQLARGFSYPQLKLNIFSEYEITGRTERAVKKTRARKVPVA